MSCHDLTTRDLCHILSQGYFVSILNAPERCVSVVHKLLVANIASCGAGVLRLAIVVLEERNAG